MDKVQILVGALVAIVTSAVTAYITVRLQSKADRKKWERELAIRYSEAKAKNPKLAAQLASDLGPGVVIVTSGEGAREKHAIPLIGGLTIGADDVCEIAISDTGISRRHARLISDGSSIHLEDFGSRNGTLVNGVRISKPVHLKSGDKFSIASYTFEIAVG